MVDWAENFNQLTDLHILYKLKAYCLASGDNTCISYIGAEHATASEKWTGTLRPLLLHLCTVPGVMIYNSYYYFVPCEFFFKTTSATTDAILLYLHTLLLILRQWHKSVHWNLFVLQFVILSRTAARVGSLLLLYKYSFSYWFFFCTPFFYASVFYTPFFMLLYSTLRFLCSCLLHSVFYAPASAVVDLFHISCSSID